MCTFKKFSEFMLWSLSEHYILAFKLPVAVFARAAAAVRQACSRAAAEPRLAC